MNEYPALTAEQREALENFASDHRHGTTGWRMDVCEMWATGRDGTNPALRNIRNLFGPSWIMDEYAWSWTPEPNPDAKWHGKGELPKIGDRVNTFNGPGVVTGYFSEGAYQGVTVRTDAPKNNHPVGHYYGPELRD